VWVKDENGNFVPPEKNKLYPVVGGLYSVQMLGAVKTLTYGILSLDPKDAQGQPIADYLPHILTTPDGLEIKEWLALSNHLHTFSDRKIPIKYATPAPRKIIDNSTSVYAFLKQPNGFALLVYGLSVVVLAMLVGCIIVITRKIRSRKTALRLYAAKK
jgi:hypothetical protein